MKKTPLLKGGFFHNILEINPNPLLEKRGFKRDFVKSTALILQ